MNRLILTVFLMFVCGCCTKRGDCVHACERDCRNAGGVMVLSQLDPDMDACNYCYCGPADGGGQ